MSNKNNITYSDGGNVICLKHDYIVRILTSALRELNKSKKTQDFSSYVDDAIMEIEDAISVCETAKQDGENMENGLKRKNDIIFDLQSKIKVYEININS